LRAHIQTLAIGVALIVFLHLKYEFVRPLLLQIVLGLKNAWGTQLYQVHLFGKQPVGELARPWKPKSPFGG